MSENESQAEQQEAQEQQESRSSEDVAGLKSALEKERKAARDAARDLKTLQARLAELEGKDKSDVERLTGERDSLKAAMEAAQQRAREKAGRAATLEAARAANAVSPKAVFAIVRDAIEYDDDDEPTNLDALIAKARKDEPDLFKASPGSGDGGRGGDRTLDANAAMNAFLRGARA